MNIFSCTEKTNLYELNLAAKYLLSSISELSEAWSWKSFCDYKNTSLNESKTHYETTFNTLHQNALAYSNMLKNYVDNHNYYEDKSLQDKYLNGEITVVKKLAIKNLKVLENRANNSKDEIEKQRILNVTEDIKNVINDYLEILRDVLGHDRKLQTILLSKGIDYKKKYDLENLD